jgi:hypothetical protein
MNLRLVLIAIILTSMLLPSICAKSSDVFIDYLTDKIWKDCQGKDIHINQPVIMDTATNQSISLIKWPYNRSAIRDIVRILGEEQEIFSTIFGTCQDSNNSIRIERINGCSILTAGNNRLDINGYNYLWNDVKVDVPQENLNIKTTYGPNSSIIETQGMNSPVTTGPNSPINQREDSIWVQLFLPKVTIPGMIVGAIITALVDLVIKRRRK